MKTLRINLLIALSVLVAGVLTVPATQAAETSWNQETSARELCFIYTLYQDWRQTRTIAANPDKFQENNPILGRHPESRDVDLYFAGCALGHAMVAYMLPPSASKVWQTAWIGIQTKVIEDNSNKGLGDEIVMEYRIEFSIPF
ncbi:hypothetical protein [Desulfoluna sp.]|uniref:hypothetical protein n=1 Tax=Desulfoluna sp. TaxID=2045199 RepID=UPI002604BBB6|nr:hypothetical protein [Desulfoluna sp.]